MAAIAGIDMSYKIGVCSTCSFAYAYQLPRTSSYEDYYQTASKYDSTDSVSRIDQIRVAAALSFCRGRVGKEARILDLGCGNGALLGGFLNGGWTNLRGVDPAPRSAQAAQSLFGVLSVYQASISKAHTVVDLADIDFICLMAVIEHLPDLRKDLHTLLAKLRPDCKILIEVPAVECFTAINNEPFGEFSLEHIQFFTASTLRNLMRSLGLSELASDVIDLPSVGAGAVLGLFERTHNRDGLTPIVYSSDDTLTDYIAESSRSFELALSCLPSGPTIIYGAGSHTARLLPQLQNRSSCQVVAIVDSNPNLIGKTMGRWTIQHSDELRNLPPYPVLVSSFRAQRAIAERLRQSFSNPVFLMYSDSTGPNNERHQTHA